MAVIVIGLGYNHSTSITITGLDAIKMSHAVYLKQSSFFTPNLSSLELLCKCKVKLITNEDHLEFFKSCLPTAASHNIAVLCPGDPFEDDFFPELKLVVNNKHISLKVVHNASMINGVGSTGLQLYRFGASSSLGNSNWHPCLEIVNMNMNRKLHSLIAIQDSNLTNESLFKELPHEVENYPELKPNCSVVLITAVGQEKQTMHKMELKDLPDIKAVIFPCCLVICSELHPMESDAVEQLSKCLGILVDDMGDKLSNLQLTLTETKNVEKTNDVHDTLCTFHLIGLGLGQPGDISIKGQKAIEQSSRVFLESYTSVMIGGKECLEKYFKKEMTVADRYMVEQNSDEILPKDKKGNVSLLIVGDPLGATTHTDLLLRAIDNGYKLDIVHNASIINAAATCGLNPNNFGEIVSVPFWDDKWKPDSFYDKICKNLEYGWHTLCLLDIKVKEQSIENLMKGTKIYEPPRFMTVAQASQQLEAIAIDRESNDCDGSLLRGSSQVIGLARIGTDDEEMMACSLKGMVEMDLGGPLHSLIIVGNSSPLEKKVLEVLSKR